MSILRPAGIDLDILRYFCPCLFLRTYVMFLFCFSLPPIPISLFISFLELSSESGLETGSETGLEKNSHPKWTVLLLILVTLIQPQKSVVRPPQVSVHTGTLEGLPRRIVEQLPPRGPGAMRTSWTVFRVCCLLYTPVDNRSINITSRYNYCSNVLSGCHVTLDRRRRSGVTYDSVFTAS